jgi:hypothetical protein
MIYRLINLLSLLLAERLQHTLLFRLSSLPLCTLLPFSL